jgi:hypothetical protein
MTATHSSVRRDDVIDWLFSMVDTTIAEIDKDGH